MKFFIRHSILFFLFLIFVLNLQKAYAQHAQVIDSLSALLNQNIHDTIRVKTLNSLAREQFEIGDTKESIVTGKQSLALAQKIGFTSALAAIYNNIGNSYSNSSDYANAELYLQKALAIRLEQKDKKGIAACLTNIGIIHYYLADYAKTLDYFQRGLKIQEELGNLRQQAASIGNIAVVYGDLHEDSLSLIYQQRSFDMHSKMGNKSDMVASLGNLSGLYLKKKNYARATECLQQALEISLKLEEKQGLCTTYGNFGALYLEQGDAQKALDVFLKSKLLANEMGNPSEISAILSKIASCYIKLNRSKDAIEAYENAYSLAHKHGIVETEKSTADGLYELYKADNNIKDALKYHEIARKLNDSIYSRSRTQILNNLKTQFALDRQEVELKAQAQQEHEKQEEEKAKQMIFIYFVLGTLLLVVVFSYFLFKRFKLTKEQNKIIENQKVLVEKKNKEITDSIQYARKIQSTLLAHKDFVSANISEHFIYFKPKDIVSGDFYWATKHDHLFYLALCDSTGHGVPGAFMSLLNIGFLSEAINEKKILEPNKVFNYVRDKLVNSISKDGQQDGFDGILLCFDDHKKELSYAAAHNHPVIISKEGVVKLGSDKMPVGKGINQDSFQLFKLNLKTEETLYIYSDGYADQFGGNNGKKLKYKQLIQLFQQIFKLPLNDQKDKLAEHFDAWKGSLEQVDDVLVIGIKI